MKRPRVLIVGCGDVGQRVAKILSGRVRVLALARSTATADRLRCQGIRPVSGDLDNRRSLARLRGLARHVIHLAPPPTEGSSDPRTHHLLTQLRTPRPGRARRNRGIVASGRLVYISTSGVYGDCHGEWVSETRPVHPESARARRRVAAEQQVRCFGLASGWRTSVLRVPGIHGRDRLPLQRLRGGQPVMPEADDSWGNHVDADDLARAVVCLLTQGRPQRTYNCCDSDPQPMGRYLNTLCRALGLPPLPEVERARIQEHISPSLWSFQRESRRLTNLRLQKETRWRPQVATVADLIRLLAAGDGTSLAIPAP